MRKNNNGVSMVSLIIVIVSVIILSALAVTSGYRYIQESQRAEKTALISMISDAAYKRQNDYNVDTKTYYEGSIVLNPEEISNENDNFKNLPENFEEEKAKITEKLNGASPLWFVLDGKSAERLGVVAVNNYEKYIVDSLEDVPKEEKKYAPVALVEYITGTTYLVEMKGTFDFSIPSDHEHIWLTATCTEPAKCRICNVTHGTELGHDKTTQTCTQAEKCRRCKMVFNEPLGHDFEGVTWTYDASKHWKECKRGCGTQIETGSHAKNYVALQTTDTEYHNSHVENCYVCGWESTETKHNVKIQSISESQHKRYCTQCDYSQIHEDGSWKFDKNEHWKECEICGEMERGQHEDESGDSICDVCHKELDTTPPNEFDSGDIAVLSRTTHQIKISAKTEDDAIGLGIKSYEFSVDNGITWNSVEVAGNDETAEYQFDNLEDNKEHTIIVRAKDRAGNYVDGNIKATTYQVPAQLVNWSKDVQGVTNGNVQITLSMPTITTLPDSAIAELNIVYNMSNEGWEKYIGPITIDKEGVTAIRTKIVDNREPEANSSSEELTINVDSIDRTPPTVEVLGTDTTEAKASHTAIIKISDALAGIAENTTVYYAWAEKGTEPTSYSTIEVETEGKEITLSVETPKGVEGQYYLWIKEGVSDAVGNVTESSIKSTMHFEVDDILPELTTRTMRNTSNEIDQLYIKNGETLTVTMKSNKELSKGPLVTLGTKSVRATSNDKINWVAKITIDNSFSEGLLSTVKFNDYISTAGKSGSEYTATTDGEYVIYDNTLPAVEYINK